MWAACRISPTQNITPCSAEERQHKHVAESACLPMFCVYWMDLDTDDQYYFRFELTVDTAVDVTSCRA